MCPQVKSLAKRLAVLEQQLTDSVLDDFKVTNYATCMLPYFRLRAGTQESLMGLSMRPQRECLRARVCVCVLS